jgi:hypothetical protein
MKKGDKIICINNTGVTHLYNLNQIYEVERILDFGDNEIAIKIKDRIFSSSKRFKFLDVKEYRKLKLKKIEKYGVGEKN